MAIMHHHIISLLLIALFAVGLAEIQLSHDKCLSYGYNSQVLQCKTCLHVSEILGDTSEAFTRCQQCCTESSKADEVRYQKAVLEVDKRSLPFSPDLDAIVKMKKDLKLTVRNRYGNARLLMFTETNADEPSEVLSVSGWTKDTFLDYLRTYYSHSASA